MHRLTFRSGPLPLKLTRLALAPLMVLLLSCGGGDASPTLPEDVGQTVRVAVATTGVDIDGDGYTVRLGTRSEFVPATGTAVFDAVFAGTHEVRLEGVAGNCTVQGGAVGSVSVSSSSGAQTSFTVVCNVDFGDGLSTVACTELSLASTAGAPMDRIAAGAVPPGLTAPLGARVLTPDGATLGYAWFEVDEQGGLELVTPLHPTGSLEGGDVLIRVTDGNVACAPLEFTIEPLPASPGELGAVVDGLQEVLLAQAAVLQTTPAELMSTPLEELDEILLPLAIVQYVLDHPENESSLRSIADGSAPEAFPLDQIEALLARVGFREALVESLGAPQRAPARGSNSVDPQTCTPEAIGTDPQRLSDCMNAFVEASGILEGFADRNGPLLSRAIFLMRTTGAQQPLHNVLASLGWIAIQEEVRSLALLPVLFTESTSRVTATPDRFNEDDPRTGVWSAEVFAKSGRWDLALGAFMAMMARSTAEGLQRLGVEEQNLEAQIRELLRGPVSDFLPSEEIASRDFGPVTVGSEEWSEVAYLPLGDLPPAIQKVAHTSYRAVAVGQTFIQVSGPPEAAGRKFGGQDFLMRAEVTVDPITIRVEPSDTVMEPGTSATFRITVENADFPRSISISAEQGTPSNSQSTGDNTFTVNYQAPSNPSFDNPDVIAVKHEERTGARANGPDRVGTATVRFGKIEISPLSVCLDTSEQATFSAVVLGLDNQDVEWTADVGTIDNNGNYTAPSDPPGSGYATIRATSAEFPALVGEIQVGIGCTCYSSITVGDRTVTAQAGDVISFGDWGGPAQPYGNNFEFYSILIRTSGGVSTYTLPLDSNPATWPTVGPNAVRVQGSVGISFPPQIIYSSDDDDPAILTLEEYVPEKRAVGSVSATVGIVSSQGIEPVAFTWRFAVTVPPGYQRGGPTGHGYRFPCTVGGG